MRMWNVPVEVLCRKHLFGEHVETHMMFGTLKRNKSIQGYIDNKLFDIRLLQKRHDDLADEIVARGYSHNSPLDVQRLDLTRYIGNEGYVDVAANLIELARRCPDCMDLQVTCG